MAQKNFTVFILFFIFATFVSKISAQSSWEITETLDSNGKYNLTRWVNMETSRIEFEVSVETTGFVGFGLSYTGDMTGADIVIGGVNEDSSTYFEDRHATSKSMPIIDESQDYHLVSADEQDGVTRMKFYREFHTCDDNDIPITEDTLKIIWSYGATDTIEYHGTNRGIRSVNLLDPPQPVPDLSGLKEWDVLTNDIMPTQDTSYWCTLHKAPPEIDRKRFMVGFEPKLVGPDSEKHTHHFILRKCVIPENEEMYEMYESHLGKPGRDCNTVLPGSPEELCQTYLFVWAKGGQMTMFPENVGFPIGEHPGKEYFMLEIHYDNPQELSQVQFTTGIKIYYSETRDIDAGLMVIGHSVYYAHTIPPNSVNFMTLGHCSPECTKKHVPETGIKIFNVLLHSHLSGRKLKVRIFRDGEELTWVSSDDNYDFNYQQNRPLRVELTVLPGDHLIYECITDTTWKNGEVTIGDLATSDEMCEAFFMYYPRIDIDVCLSTVDLALTFKTLGIEDIIDNPENSNNPIITAPASMANLTYIDALQTVVNWTPELRKEFQEVVRFQDQYFACAATSGEGDSIEGIVSYPNVEHEYQPVNPCLIDDTSTTEREDTSTVEIASTVVDGETTTADIASTVRDDETTNADIATTARDDETTNADIATTARDGETTKADIATTARDGETTKADSATTARDGETTKSDIATTVRDGETTKSDIATTVRDGETTKADDIPTTVEVGRTSTTVDIASTVEDGDSNTSTTPGNNGSWKTFSVTNILFCAIAIVIMK